MTKQIKPSEFAMQIRTDAHRWKDAAISALFDEATAIMNKSIPITPLDKGDLRRSAYVARPKMEGGNATVEMGYGGFASAYALAVHEMSPMSNFQEPGTGPKYLERPFDAAKRGQATRISANAFTRFLSGMTAIRQQHNTRPQ